MPNEDKPIYDPSLPGENPAMQYRAPYDREKPFFDPKVRAENPAAAALAMPVPYDAENGLPSWAGKQIFSMLNGQKLGDTPALDSALPAALTMGGLGTLLGYLGGSGYDWLTGGEGHAVPGAVAMGGLGTGLGTTIGHLRSLHKGASVVRKFEPVQSWKNR